MRRRGAKSAGGRFGKPSRTSLGLVCGVAVAVELFVAMPGCLNPRPEELPSNDSQLVEPEPVPVRESCNDNPLLAGCDLPQADTDSNPISPPAEEPAPEPLSGTLDVSDSPDVADAGSPTDAGL